MRFPILLLLIVGACSRTETSEPAAQAPEATAENPETPPEQTPAEQPPEAAAAAEAQQEGALELKDLDALPTVELLEAGKAPRKALRATFETGAKQSLRVESNWTLETVYGPLLQTKSVMPSLIYVLDTEVKEAQEERTQFALRVAKVTAKPSKEVQPAQAEAGKKAAASLEGATGSFSIDSRGMVEELTIDAPSDASLLAGDMIDQIKQAIRLSSLPLPEEPVGEGAKWTVTQVVEQRTAKIAQSSTFELVNVEGEVVRATSTHAAEAPKQKLKLPGSREGASFKLDKVELVGDSKGAWPLNRLGPKSASEHTVSALGMTARKPRHESVIMAVDTTLEVKAER
jgi:hypothetical protein